MAKRKRRSHAEVKKAYATARELIKNGSTQQDALKETKLDGTTYRRLLKAKKKARKTTKKIGKRTVVDSDVDDVRVTDIPGILKALRKVKDAITSLDI